MNLKHLIKLLFEHFYKEKGDMELSGLYEDIVKEVPEVDVIWSEYKLKVEEADIILRYKFEKLLQKISEETT